MTERNMMQSTAAAVIVTVVCMTYLPAQTVRFDSDMRIPEEACMSPVMDADVFAESALIASGVSDEQLPLLKDRLENLYVSFKSRQEDGETETETAERALHFMYDSVLSSYSENQTCLDTALDTGAYNCVSSAVLFMYMMKKEGIAVKAVETPLHAFCTVDADGTSADVETTNPWGFRPGTMKPVPSDSLSRKKFVTVPARKYASRHDIDDRRIIALIYSNRMSDLQKQKKDSETVGLASDAVRLQNNAPEAVQTLYKCVYNTAVDLSGEGRDEEGIALIREASARFGTSPLYGEYAYAAAASQAGMLMKQKRYADAAAAVENCRDLIDESSYREMTEGILFNSLNNDISTLPAETALAHLHDSRMRLSEERYARLVSYAYASEAQRTADSEGWLAGAAAAEKGLEELPADETLRKLRSLYRRNYAAEVHNNAARMFNSGDKDGAKYAVREGLEKIPESTILADDMKRF